MKHIKDVTINENKVTLRFQDRDRYGYITARQQITLSKREFEKALRDAGVTVPWHQVRDV